MHVAIVTFDGFNELDSLVALGILNRARKAGLGASIASNTPRVVSMHGVTMDAPLSLRDAGAADAVLIGSGKGTRQLVADAALMASLRLDPVRQLVAAQCSGALVLARLGLLRGLAACTDATSAASLKEAGVAVLAQPFFARGNIATAGGCLAAPILAAWLIARLAGIAEAKAAIAHVAPVGEKAATVDRILKHVLPCLPATSAPALNPAAPHNDMMLPRDLA